MSFSVFSGWTKRKLVSALGVLLACVVMGIIIVDPGNRRWEAELSVPGVDRPAVVPAAEARLADDELVIGVSVGDFHRAYRMTAFWPPKDLKLSGPDDPGLQNLRSHVVNDLIHGTPITVVHCVRTQCTRVLTDATQESPLPVQLGGFRDREMLLLIDEERFEQSSVSLPFSDHSFSLVEWRQWRKWFPDTDVYVGPPSAG